jgi:3-oxoacyl-[acyl-carrier protein] reductase
MTRNRRGWQANPSSQEDEFTMDLGLDGRVAVVTGAARGIGRATAQLLASEGVRIVAADLREPELAGFDEGAIAVAVDVADPEGAKALVDASQAAFGRLDILVCSAGVYETNSLLDLGAQEWDRVQAINLRGTFLCAQAAVPAMAANGWGRIVLLSSLAALTGGLAAGASYVASKAGVMGLTRSLANHVGPLGITVNCVNPGIIETPMTEALEREQIAARTPVRRNGTPEDVASIITMLASDRAGFVTGAHLSINGGLVAD